MRKHKLGQQGHGLLALDVVDGLHEETAYKEGRPEASAVSSAAWRTEWSRCLGKNLFF